jgi:hypothetical protein
MHQTINKTMHHVQRVCSMVFGLAVSALFLGCGGPADDLPRQAVSGTVTFKGKPLEAGMIQFQPGSAGVATAGQTEIADGKYAISQSEGLVPGQYLVTITSATPKAAEAPTSGPPAMPGDAPPPPKETIPAQYNARSKLTANVTKEGPNTFPFDLKDK